MSKLVWPRHSEQQTILVVGVVLSIGLGIVTTFSSYVLILIAGMGLLGIFLLLEARTTRLFYTALAILLIGYLLQGRGFAYLRPPFAIPIYVGELVLFAGIGALFLNHRRVKLGLLEYLILAFCVLGMIRSVPLMDEYGLDAIRDSALWYYSIFAILVVTFLTRTLLDSFFSIYAKLLPFFLIWFVVMSTLLPLLEDSLPHVLGSPLPILSSMKPGDRAVMLTGFASFLITGLAQYYAKHSGWVVNLSWTLWLGSVAIVSIANRGGFVALAVSLLFLALIYRSGEWLRIALISALILGVVVAVDPEIDLGGTRQISIDQFLTNITSIFSSDASNTGYVNDTKDWRLDWWSAIMTDTVGGHLTWQGWGFGPNLAAEYGVITPETEQLRSPHNGHLTVLARMGIPGLALWIALQATFAIQMIKSYFSSIEAKDLKTAAIAAWLLTMWIAIMINSFFDVYLEGPQGAIPFWCVFGAGIAVVRWVRSSRSSNFSAMPQSQVLPQ